MSKYKIIYDLWKTSFRINGLKGLIRSVDLFRCYEWVKIFSLIKDLEVTEGTIVDIGSGRGAFAPFLALNTAFKVIATDVDDPQFGDSLSWQCSANERLSLTNFEVRFADARMLDTSLENTKVDIITAISTLEHFKGRGDMEAVHQFGKTLKPSGYCIITVPYSEVFIESSEKGYFERTYDKTSLRERIVLPSGLQLRDLRFFGLKTRGGRLYGNAYLSNNRILYYLSRVIRPILLPLFPRWVGEVDEDKAGGVLLVLEKEHQRRVS